MLTAREYQLQAVESALRDTLRGLDFDLYRAIDPDDFRPLAEQFSARLARWNAVALAAEPEIQDADYADPEREEAECRD